MRNRRNEKFQEREYKILFLLWEKERIVCAWISFSQTPDIELRKRWMGLTSSEEQFLTEDSICKKPETLMWEVGLVRREVAVYALQKWQTDFELHGFEIVGKSEDIVAKHLKPILKNAERARLAEISVDALLQNMQQWHIVCKDQKGKEKNSAEKFVVNPASESLSVRTTEDVANAFRQYCRDNALTQSQALASLLDKANQTGDENILVRDLADRLGKADEQLKQAYQKNENLQNALKKEKQSKEYPKKYQAARLQDELLKAFFHRVSSPKSPGMIKLKKCSPKISAHIFPERGEYNYPDHDGVILLYLEHMAFEKTTYPPLFIYGRDADGNKKKVRWYYKRSERYGISMWESPYLFEGAPWLIAVQKTGDVADMVGSLPVIDVNWSNIKTMEDIFALQELIEAQEKYIVDLEQELDGLKRERGDGANKDTEIDRSKDWREPLDEVIRKINEGS